MDRLKVFGSGALVMAAALMPAGAPASVDRTPKPGGVYRLKPGVYAPTRRACGSAPIPTLRNYDGLAIHDASTKSCRTKIISRVGDHYSAVQTCLVNGRVPPRATMEHQNVTVTDALSFQIGTEGRRTSYRYCPAYMLPANIERVFR